MHVHIYSYTHICTDMGILLRNQGFKAMPAMFSGTEFVIDKLSGRSGQDWARSLKHS